MSKAYKCDKCGELFPEDSANYLKASVTGVEIDAEDIIDMDVNFSVRRILSVNGTDRREEAELCRPCLVLILRFALDKKVRA